MGNAQQGLSLVRAAQSNLGEDSPAVATGWLAATEAVAHTAGKNAQATDAALIRTFSAVERTEDRDAPPWPWVFAFDAAKVESYRVTCGALLGLPEWTASAYNGARAVLTGGHDKQRALLLLDVAGQLAPDSLKAHLYSPHGRLKSGCDGDPGASSSAPARCAGPAPRHHPRRSSAT